MFATKPTSKNHLWTSWSESCGLIWSDGLQFFLSRWEVDGNKNDRFAWMFTWSKVQLRGYALAFWFDIFSTQNIKTVMDRMKAKQTAFNCLEMLYAFRHRTKLQVTIELGPMSPHSNLTRRWITATSWRVCETGPMYIHVKCGLANITGLWHSTRSQRCNIFLAKAEETVNDSKCIYCRRLGISDEISDEHPILSILDHLFYGATGHPLRSQTSSSQATRRSKGLRSSQFKLARSHLCLKTFWSYHSF